MEVRMYTEVLFITALAIIGLVTVVFVAFASYCISNNKIRNRLCRAVDLLGEMEGIEDLVDRVDGYTHADKEE